MRDREGEKKEEGKRKEGDKEMREYWIGEYDIETKAEECEE